MKPETQSTSPGRRILVADDNVDAADSLAMILTALGHEVHVAYDGAAALDAANTLHPEVVLLDIGMPTMNGYDVASRIREQPWAGQACLIALTGWGQDDDKDRARSAGFDHHLVKPLELDRIQQILAELKPAGRAR
jgi:CheY-like chemotaxis protein